MPLQVQGRTVPHWKALRYGNHGSRGLSCSSTSRLCQYILKSDNLLHKEGFVKTQSLQTVILQGWQWTCTTVWQIENLHRTPEVSKLAIDFYFQSSSILLANLSTFLKFLSFKCRGRQEKVCQKTSNCKEEKFLSFQICSQSTQCV